MIQENKQKWALKIVHDLIIRARWFAYQEKDSKFMAGFLDEVEYLPALMLDERGETDFFERYAKGICEKYNCSGILTINESLKSEGKNQ